MQRKTALHTFSKYALVVVGSLATGATLFLGSFAAMSFVWTRLVVPNPEDFGLGDGVMVVYGGFVLGCVLGVAGLAVVLYKFWPRRIQH